MCRRGEPSAWGILWLAGALTLPAAAQELAQDATPDGAVEQYLAERGLSELLATQLRDRLRTASEKAKPAIAERLGKLYVEMLDRASTPEERRRIEDYGRALLDEVPEADSYDLRVNLAKASYLHAEAIAEKYRLRLATPEEKADADATLRSLLPTFQGIGVKVNGQVERLEKLEETGGDSDEATLKDRLAEVRRIRSLAMYYAGWSSYYLGLLNGQSQFPTEALKFFGWLLNSPNGRTASVDRISGGLLRYEHVARAAVGAALCESLRGNDDAALRWLDLVEQTDGVSDAVKGQLLSRRIDVLASALRWADLDFLLSRRRKGKDRKDAMLSVGEARLLAVYSLESLGRSDMKEQVRPLVEALAAIGMGDLVSRGEVGQVLDLVDRYGSAPMGTEGFIVNYVRGLQAYEHARKSQTDGGENPDEPTRLDAVANEYRSAAGLLDAAFGTSDAGAYPSERTNAAMVQGLSLFHAGDYEAASKRLEQAHQTAATAPQADEALWLALVALDRAVEAGKSSLTGERDRLVVLYLQSYPSGERAARLVLRQGSGAGLSDDQTLSTLLGIPQESPLYATSRRQAARLLYKAYRGASGADRDFAAVRFVGIAEPILAMDRDSALAGGPDAGPAAESAVVLARQVLDASMAISTPDLARASAAIDTLERLSKQAGVSLGDFADELTFRRFQIALARGDRAEADSSLATLHATGGKYSDAADRLLYREALQQWTAAPQDPARARMLVEIGKRIIAQFPAGPEPLADAAVAAAFDTIARAAVVVWRAERDESMRSVALDCSRRLLQAGRKTRDVLRRIAELAESNGATGEALDAWRDLLASLPQDSPEWFEARYQSLRLLAGADPARAAEVMRQHKLLHPEFGPPPWGARLRELDAQLGGGGVKP